MNTLDKSLDDDIRNIDQRFGQVLGQLQCLYAEKKQREAFVREKESQIAIESKKISNIEFLIAEQKFLLEDLLQNPYFDMVVVK